MKENESIFIEEYGDITTSSEQIEVKKYEDNLTDRHPNFWNTLSNWYNPDFDIYNYDSLVLLTTQEIWKDCSFKNWNNKTVDGKIKILKDIRKKWSKDQDIQKAMDAVFVDEERLRKILKKFIILDSSESSEWVIESICQKQLKWIPKKNWNFVV